MKTYCWCKEFCFNAKPKQNNKDMGWALDESAPATTLGSS